VGGFFSFFFSLCEFLLKPCARPRGFPGFFFFFFLLFLFEGCARRCVGVLGAAMSGPRVAVRGGRSCSSPFLWWFLLGGVGVGLFGAGGGLRRRGAFFFLSCFCLVLMSGVFVGGVLGGLFASSCLRFRLPRGLSGVALGLGLRPLGWGPVLFCCPLVPCGGPFRESVGGLAELGGPHFLAAVAIPSPGSPILASQAPGARCDRPSVSPRGGRVVEWVVGEQRGPGVVFGVTPAQSQVPSVLSSKMFVFVTGLFLGLLTPGFSVRDARSPGGRPGDAYS